MSWRTWLPMEYFAHFNFDSIQNALVILDIDGTLVHDGLASIDEATLANIKSLQRGGNSIFLCSNRKNHSRNQILADLTGVFYLNTPLCKPNPKILSLIQTPHPETIFVIGDKCLTDGLFSYRIGAQFIKVKRLEKRPENFRVALVNRIDDFLSPFFSLFSP